MDSSISLRDKAAAGVAWSTLHTWGSHALQLGVVLVLARLLEPGDFGLFAMAQVVLVLTQALASQGIPDALIQANRTEPTVWSTGFIAVLLGSAGAAFLLLLTAAPLALLFRTPALASVIRWLAPMLVLYGIHAVLYARARSDLAFAGYAIAGLAGAVGAFAAGIPAAFAGWGVWALVISAYAGILVETALLGRATGGIELVRFDTSTYRQLLRYGRFITAGALTTFLNRRTDDYFVGLYLGPDVLGYYAVAYRLLELVTTVSLRAVERVAFPVFSKLQEWPALMSDAIHTTFRFTSLVAFPAFAGVALVAPDLVVVALGPRWIAAALPLQILALAGVALCATNVLPSVIRAAGVPQWNVTISLIKGVLLTAAFALVARHGLEAVAWTFTLGTYAVFPFFYLAIRRLVPMSLKGYLAEAVRPFLATSIMAIGILLASPLLQPLAPMPRLLLNVAMGVVLYALCMLAFAPEQTRELYERIRRLRPKRPDPAE